MYHSPLAARATPAAPLLRPQPGPCPAHPPGVRNPPSRAAYLSGAQAQGQAVHAAVDGALQDHVLSERFPCVAARSAFNKGNYRFGLMGALGSTEATALLHAGLVRFAEEFDSLGSDLVTYLAVFDGPQITDDEGFETLMWQQLQSLHLLDARQHAWADGVSSDASRSDFSFSVAGRAFFIVGMHPMASRLSRRSPRPTLVFNFHEQFEALRANGKYEGMKQVIRQRDLALQGSINPALASFGESSEARQYAGRQVPADWACPFHTLHGAGQ